jgi:hypothetical protein
MIAFFVLCVSILLITRGELGALAGVYAFSFLSVMALFGLGNHLLKTRRARLPRPERASGWALLVAIGAALVGNALMHPPYLLVFLQYFIPTVALVALMLYGIELLKLTLFLIKSLPGPFRKILRRVAIRKAITRINSLQFVYFTKGHNIINLNKGMLYILKNEDTHRIKIVTLVKDQAQVPKNLPTDIDVLDRAYPEFDVDFVVIKGSFEPKLIDELSLEWNIPKNFMFMASPGDGLPYKISEFGGVRLII